MNRRDVIKTAAIATAAFAMPNFVWGNVGGKRLKVGLVGCSGRGLDAILDMLNAAKGTVEIVAIADLFPDRIEPAMKRLEKYSGLFGKECIDVPESHRFSGWNAYKDILSVETDIIISATPPVFRPLHLREFVNAGKHIFVEKPACVDPVQARELYEISDIATQKGLTIIPGVQRRFHQGYQELVKRIQDGQIGDIVAGQALWLNSRFFIQNGGNLNLQCPNPEELEYQIRNWFIYAWASGDCYVEQHVHNLDVIRWIMDKDPQTVIGLGGRVLDIPYPELGDRFSHFAVDYDFGDGVHIASYSRRENKTNDIVTERIMGTKGYAEMSLGGQRIFGPNAWEADKKQPQCLIEEHRILIDSVLNNKKVNMLSNMVDSTLMAIAGRESAYSGKNFKYDWIKKRSAQSHALQDWKFGKHPLNGIPIPGKYKLT